MTYLANRKTTDFFTKYAVLVAFLGFGLIIVFYFAAWAVYTQPWTLETNSLSDLGSIYANSRAAGFFAAGTVLASSFCMPVVVVYLRRMAKTWKQTPQACGLIGLLLMLAGRVLGVLIGAFPTMPWTTAHGDFADLRNPCEILAMAFIGIEMLRGAKVNNIKHENPDLLWGIVPFVLIAVVLISCIPFLMHVWTGEAIPEIVDFICEFTYSIALWIRAWMGNDSIGPARPMIEPAVEAARQVE
jgi:hypothetical membrane protein